MQPFLENARAFLERLSLGQKAALVAVIVGGAALLIGIAYWANRPDYTLLFGRLDPIDANKIVESLQSQGVQYELRENGTAVWVPREQVYELRLQFAGDGVVTDGITGYELFDQGTLGMTDFMQKLNLRRALEGELARTISAVRQVELARVHLVMPERSPFREAQTAPSASVVLQLAGGGRLDAEQIQGITALVAGAVEGLDPRNVTVLDTRGNMLSNPDAGDPDALANTNQLRIQRAMEEHLVAQGQTMLDRMLGHGNAIVRVAATLDLTRSVAERDLIDPESATVIAEEQLEENQNGGEANSRVRNYEISRTRERAENTAAKVSYLTVSVILNYKTPNVIPAADGEVAASEPEPYTEAEIAEIENVLKNAVGFNPERGDRFAIHQTRFDTSVDDQIAAEMQEQRQTERLQLYLRYGLMVLALAAAAWLLRSAARRVAGEAGPLQLAGGLQARSLEGDGGGKLGEGSSKGALPEGDDEEGDDELVLIDDVYTSKLSPEARKRLKAKHLMFEEIQQSVIASPDNTAELIRTWMAEDHKEALH